MKKKTLRSILIFITAFAITIAINVYLDNRNYYEIGENGNFEVNTGETFTIKLDVNGSTGYTNCWLSKSKLVKLMSTTYEPGLNARIGYIGAGGTTTYTFKAVSTGVDTLYFKSCPTGPERKDCSDYDLKDKPDNTFSIMISE